MRGEVASLQKQFATLNAEMQAVSTGSYRTSGMPDAAKYARTAASVEVMSKAFRNAANSTGLFEVTQHRIGSQTQEYTKLLQKQKLSFRDIIKNRSILKATYAEQLRMQKSFVTSWGRDASGNMMADMVVPKTAIQDMDSFGKKINMLGHLMASGSQQMINWGKNMQWAGRQMTVGLTMPVVAFGAAAGVMAFKADAALTRIAKVYDTTTTAGLEGNARMRASENELAVVRKNSMSVATFAAKQYGVSINDTLDASAQLAATGANGAELYQRTSEVMRVATLGELDYNDAVQASIALQSTFRLSTDEQTKAWNFMNSAENASSLSMQDFTQAIPIAGGAIADMGGSVEDLGILLTGMKERGINATQGANAIKASFQRLLRPSQQVQAEFQQLTGKSITELVTKSKGELIPTFTAIANSMDGLNKLDRGKAITGLFGTYQRSRLSAVLNSMKDLENGEGQISRVAKLVGDDVGNSAIAASELAKQSQSVSGQWKRALYSLQAELAKTGEQFLKMGVHVLHGLKGIIDFFNNMPKWAKNLATWVVIGTAIAGPIVMLVGLLGNLVGTIGKTVAFFMKLGRRLGLVTAEEKAFNLMTAEAAPIMTAEQEAAATLSAQMVALSESLTIAKKAQQDYMIATEEAALATSTAGRAVANPQGLPPHMLPGGAPWAPAPIVPPNRYNVKGADGRFISREDLAAQKAAAAESEKIAKEGDKARTSWRGAGISMGVAAGSMLAMSVSSNEAVDNFAQMALVLSLFGPGIGMLYKGLKAAGPVAGKFIGKMVTGAVGFGAALRAAPLTALKTGLAAAGTSLVGMLGTATGVGVVLAGAGFAIYKLWQHQKAATVEMKAMYDDAQGLADIIGYAATENATVDTSGNSIQAEAEQLDALRRKYPDLINQIKDAGSAQASLNAAMQVGAQVISTGGTAEQAKAAVEIALKSALGKDSQKSISLLADIDFSKAKAQLLAFQSELSTGVNDSIANVDGGLISRIFGGNDASDEAKKQADTAAKAWVQQWNISQGDPKARAQVIKSLQDQLNSYNDAIDREMKAGNGERAQQIMDVRFNFIKDIGIQKGVQDVDAWAKRVSDAGGYMKMFGEYQYTGAIDAAHLANAYDVLNNSVFDMSKKEEITSLEIKKQNGMLNEAGVEYLKRLKALEKMSPALDSIQNIFDIISGKTGQAEAAAAALNSQYSKSPKLVAAMQKVWSDFDWVSAQKDVMSQSQSTISGMMQDEFNANMDASMQAVQDQGQAALDRLDAERQARLRAYDMEQKHLDHRQEVETNQFNKAWEKRLGRVEDFYGAQSRAAENALEQEQRAEEIRQRMFDAEMARLSRLAEAANRNIDFNVALDTGALDEAARIRNDMEAASTGWSMQDENTRAGNQSQDRQDRLQKTIDKIDKEKEKRLEALKKVEDAERRSMERRQDMQDRELARERRHYEHLMDIREQAQEDTNALNVEAEQSFIDTQKRAFDVALAALEAYIPRNERDMKKHIADIQQKYGDFGGVLTNYQGKWDQQITSVIKENTRNAARSLKSDINWAGVGQHAAQQFIKGAFPGMSMKAFRKWVGLPAAPTKDTYSDFGTRHPDAVKVPRKADHDGGPVEGRTGYPRSQSAFPSETWRLLKKDEYVVNGKTHRALGTDYFDSLQMAHHQGGAVSTNMGMAGLMGAGGTGMLNKFLQKGIKIMGKTQQAVDTANTITSSIGSIFSGGSKVKVNMSDPDRKVYMDGEPLSAISAAQIQLAERKGGRDLTVMQGSWQKPSSYSGTSHTGAGVADVSPGDFSTQYWMRKAGFAAWGRNFPGAATAGSGAHVHAVSMIDPGAAGNAQVASYRAGGDGLGGADYGPRPEMYKNIADMLPQARTGMITLSDGMLKAHKGETVLDQPLTKKFKEGVTRFANGQTTVYDIDIHATPGMDENALVKKVIRAIDHKDRRVGGSRKVGA